MPGSIFCVEIRRAPSQCGWQANPARGTVMPEPASTAAREPRRGREARRSARAQRSAASVPYITRKIPLTEILSEEGLEIIERNADALLEEIGVEFRDFPRALDLFRGAGCDVKGERVRFPRGLARQLCATAPVALRAARAQPGAQRRHRRRRDGVRAELRLALRPRPRQGPPLRDARGLPELRQARVSEPLHPPFGRHACASRSICRSTSGTSRWSMPISNIPTSRSWAR